VILQSVELPALEHSDNTARLDCCVDRDSTLSRLAISGKRSALFTAQVPHGYQSGLRCSNYVILSLLDARAIWSTDTNFY